MCGNEAFKALEQDKATKMAFIPTVEKNMAYVRHAPRVQ